MIQKIMTICGTRPELIRLSLIISKLDKKLEKNHIFVWAGQNSNALLSTIFFKELKIRVPNYNLDMNNSSFGYQIGDLFTKIEQLLIIEKPTKILVLGDTTSALSAIVCERYQIPVYHMEAGNRCNNKILPEEINRKLIDSISTYNLPYTPNSHINLLRNGILENFIYETGNPIKEVIEHYIKHINKSSILNILNLKPFNYILSTFHHAEGTKDNDKLTIIINALKIIYLKYKKIIICTVHPSVKNRLYHLFPNNLNGIVFISPLGFFDFVKLEKNAWSILTDSGTVQEEACIFDIPTITIRNSTERPETIECGSNIVSGLQNSNEIISAFDFMVSNYKRIFIPKGYDIHNVSNKVVSFLLKEKK